MYVLKLFLNSSSGSVRRRHSVIFGSCVIICNNIISNWSTFIDVVFYMVLVEMSAILFGCYPWRCGSRGQSYAAMADATVDYGVIKVSVVFVTAGAVVLS